MEVIQSFENSISRLKEVLEEEKTVINRDSAIKRFELTFELAWKSTQHLLRDQGIVCRSPREALKEAFKFGLIEDDDIWLKMLSDRNLSIHTYNESLAENMYQELGTYLQYFNSLVTSLKKYL